MRDYAAISPQFWTGKTGKIIRELGADAQRVALYLMTCPSANALGLYYLPLPTLCHEVGISSEGASKALLCLSEAAFSHYDSFGEYVWVPEMARFQIGESLSTGDKRVKWVIKELMSLSKTKFFNDFLEKYRDLFHLNSVAKNSCPIDAPSMPHRSQEQEQEQEQELKKEKVKKKEARVFNSERIKICESLNTPAFKEKWETWVMYRMKLKKPKDPAAMFSLQLEKLVPLGVDRAIEVLDFSLANEYQGLFPERINGNGHMKQIYREPGSHHQKTPEQQRLTEQNLINQGIEFLSEALDENSKFNESAKFETITNWSGLLEAKLNLVSSIQREKVDCLLTRASDYKKQIMPKIKPHAHASR